MFDSSPQRRVKKKKQEGLFKFWEFVDAVAAGAPRRGAAVGQQVVVYVACFHFSSQSLIMARKLACPVRFPIGTVLQPLSPLLLPKFIE